MVRQTITDVTIELHVPNFQLAEEFYGHLGFKIVWEVEPEGQKGYIVMKREKSYLCFFCGNGEVYDHSYFKKFPKYSKRGYGVEISIPVQNIDKYYQEAYPFIKDNVVEPLEMKPWGKREFRVEDPNGFYVKFTDPVDLDSKDY